MAVPWLRLFDMLIGVSDIARGGRSRPAAADKESQQLAPGSRALGHLETVLDTHFTEILLAQDLNETVGGGAGGALPSAVLEVHQRDIRAAQRLDGFPQSNRGSCVKPAILPEGVEHAIEKWNFLFPGNQVGTQCRIEIRSGADVHEFERAAGIDDLADTDGDSRILQRSAKSDNVRDLHDAFYCRGGL